MPEVASAWKASTSSRRPFCFMIRWTRPRMEKALPSSPTRGMLMCGYLGEVMLLMPSSYQPWYRLPKSALSTTVNVLRVIYYPPQRVPISKDFHNSDLSTTPPTAPRPCPQGAPAVAGSRIRRGSTPKRPHLTASGWGLIYSASSPPSPNRSERRET